MEGIDGGLNPAVDGQSLGEMWIKMCTQCLFQQIFELFLKN